MATIKEEIIIIKISQLIKHGAQVPDRITPDVSAALTQVVEELVGAGAVVEIESAQ